MYLINFIRIVFIVDVRKLIYKQKIHATILLKYS